MVSELWCGVGLGRKDAERETVKLQPRFQTADKLRMGVKNSAAVSHM